jgi:RNA polymerase sigma-70 factor (ECF subfamily)
VEGSLVGLYVEELRAACAGLRDAGSPWTLDVAGILFADSKGVALLAELGAAGNGHACELMGSSPFLRALLGARPSATARLSPGGWDAPQAAALRRGDERAREELVRHFGPEMLVTARRLLGSEDEAHLALREAFWAAFEAVELPEPQRFASWLRRLVVRAALRRTEALRRASAAEELGELLPRFDESGVRAHDEADELDLQEGPGAHLEALDPEQRETVRACVDRLPETHRAVLLLCDVEGFGLAEAASLLSLEPSEVESRLHRSRQALRRLLAQALGAGWTRCCA